MSKYTFKHTPGPWRSSYDRGHFVETEHGEETNVICECREKNGTSRLNDYEARANAALIASAPRLLELLKDYVAHGDCEGDAADRPHRNCLYCESLDAIERAEGLTK